MSLVKARCLLIILSIAAVFCAAQEVERASTRPPTTSSLRTQHSEVLRELNTSRANKSLDLDDPEVRPLLYRGWELAGQWAAFFLDKHPTSSPVELRRIFNGFAPKPEGRKSKYGDFLEYEKYWFDGDATRITPAVYVVHACYGKDFSTGTFMVVAREPGGRFKARWSIKPIAEEHYSSRDEIGRWAHLVRRAYYNGPLDVRGIYPLRSGANGSPRFMVDAVQNADGGTALGQLSIWEWNGNEAKSLLIEAYEYALDSYDFRFDGRDVRIATKEEAESFFSCGSCSEPRGMWRLRITPSGVENLGHQFQKPELKWADELLSKVEKGVDTTDIADSKVAIALKDYIKTSGSPTSGEKFYWGMLDGCRILSRGRRGAFIVNLDEAHLHLRYIRRGGKAYFTHIKIQ